jgi:hypothetical protein
MNVDQALTQVVCELNRLQLRVIEIQVELDRRHFKQQELLNEASLDRLGDHDKNTRPNDR